MTDFGSELIGRVSSVKYFMNRMTDKVTNFVGKLMFQGSNDNSTWEDIFTADIYIREGWNTYTPSSSLKYRYYRFYANSSSSCQVAEIQLMGNIVEDSSATTKVCDVMLYAPGNVSQTFSSHVTYDDAASSVVTGISPRYGTYRGGETVTFTGTGFSTTTGEISITIDDIDCPVDSATATQLTCTTGQRSTINPNPSTMIRFDGSSSAKNGYASMQTYSFKYANYWSDLETWSGEYTPQAGDSISVPVGQTLVVNVDSTPVVNAIIVEGSLVFLPDATATHHRTLDASYIYISNGAIFEAGTETERYTSRLTITMHGNREDPQLPIYGNKGVFVRFGQIDMHGVVRDYTWVELENTLSVGGNQITLNTTVDWQVGEEIVIAPTDFEVDHAEAFEITAVDNSNPSNTVLTLNTTALYKHYAGSTSFTGSNGINADMTKTLEMRAEVGLLTRNVVYKGADDDSVANQYGAHIMLHSSGDDSLTGRFSYIELTQVGQAFQLGRYPIHFHMIGTLHNSYIKGNALHHTYNRACTIHGVHYLTLEKNVAYQTMGHTFFIEDGAETKNVLIENLAVKTKRSWSLLNTDQTPASFWITHPDNQFIRNHAAGSDRYGFWFDLQEHPTGPSYDPEICPEFDQLGEFTGNVAHSNGRYGLRIFHRFNPSADPCAALNTWAHGELEMYSTDVTTPIVTHFRDFLGYKNKRNGIIVEECGALKFHNIRTADNLLAGVEFSITATGPWLTDSDDYHLQDALIVGFSENVESEQTTHVSTTDSNPDETRGLIGAKTEKMRIKDVLFANFDYNSSTWGAIGTCSHCDGPATNAAGRTYFTKNLYFFNTTQRVTFDTPFKEILYDQDGSLGNNTHRWVVHYYKHLDISECMQDQATYNGLLCSSSISIRRVLFYSPLPFSSLKNLPMKIMNMDVVPAIRRNRRSLVSPTSCSTLSTFSLQTINNDYDAVYYTKQQDLLNYYDQYATAKINYNQAIEDAENGNTSAVATANSLSTQMTEITTNITTLESEINSTYGFYDDLYMNDTNFCDTEMYAGFEFRIKNNPSNNWVFPVATNYEYKVHIAQGADFTQLTGQYSYYELIENDTQGVVLHFNHTERTEMFYFNYTHSNGTSMSANKSDMVVTHNGSNGIGTIYMNNVTRHMALKLDASNQDAVSFVLAREECITVGG